jgi:hypothetical protein
MIAIVALVVGGAATVTLVETNTVATVALVGGAVFLLLVMTLMTMLVSFLRDLQIKATKLLEAHPSGRDVDATRGLLESLRELKSGTDAVGDTPIAPGDGCGPNRPTRGTSGPVAGQDPSAARDEPTP